MMKMFQLKGNLQFVYSGNMSSSNLNHVDVSITQDIVFINYETILYNLSSSVKTLKTKNSKRLLFGNLNINAIINLVRLRI